MKILSLDPATVTGYASDIASGVQDCSTRPNESKGLRIIRFVKFLNEMIDVINPDIIAYEKPGGRNYSALRVHSQLEGQIIEICENRGIEYKGYSAGEIKKHATGNGNSNKSLMIKTAKEKWPMVNIIDDNHADAMWLHDLAKNDFAV